MIETNKTLQIIPIHVIDPRLEKEHAIHIGEELESLITTLGATIVQRVVQRMDRPDHATYIGKGKAAEVAEIVKQKQVDVVVLNAMAKPGQIHNLKGILQKENPQIDVWDRVDLILHIFDKHATTTEAKLQIELARMRYMGPRIYGMGFVMSRQGGGIGTVGVGETNTELMKRHWRDEIKKITEQLAKLGKTREQQLERRKRAGFKTVSIIGYTNAGKSSLFNKLSGKHNLTENALFATLDSAVGKIYLPQLKSEILITDTIGFIRDLPPRLIQAFKSTLMESLHADVLLHVIDVSDPERDIKIQVVNDILKEMGRNTDDVVYIFNKTDRVPDLDTKELLEQYRMYSPLFVSVKSGEGIPAILETITHNLSAQ